MKLIKKSLRHEVISVRSNEERLTLLERYRDVSCRAAAPSGDDRRIVDQAMLEMGTSKLEALQQAQMGSRSVVVSLKSRPHSVG